MTKKMKWEPWPDHPGEIAQVHLFVTGWSSGFTIRVRVYPAQSPIDGPVWHGEAHLGGDHLFTVHGKTKSVVKRKVVAQYKSLLKRSLTALGRL